MHRELLAGHVSDSGTVRQHPVCAFANIQHGIIAFGMLRSILRHALFIFRPAAIFTLDKFDINVVVAGRTRVHTRESVSVAQSTFMIDLLQMSNILRRATPRSLVVIDEFGKGSIHERTHV